MKIGSSDDEIDTKDYRTTNTIIKEGGNDGNVQVTDPDVEIVVIPGDDELQGFVSQSDKEDVMPKIFDILSLPEGTSMYYISPEVTNLFHPKESQNMIS